MARPKSSVNQFAGLLKQSGQARGPIDPTSIASTSEREAGRRRREGFTQVAGYVPADLYKQVKKKLFDEERNFSELLESWMNDYVVKRLSD